MLRHSAGSVGTYDCMLCTLIVFITNVNALHMLEHYINAIGIPNSLTRGECGEACLHINYKVQMTRLEGGLH